MSVVFEKHSFESNHDVELGIERKNPAAIELAYPAHLAEEKGLTAEEKLKGVVFYVAGFAADPEHSAALIKKIAREQNLLAIALYYHCFFTRPSQGAAMRFTQANAAFLRPFIRGVDQLQSTKQLDQIAEKISEPLHLLAQLQPVQDEYQNFGVLQALDLINAFYFAKYGLNLQEKADFGNAIVLGSSHGGYIAHLAHKMAPNLFRYIIDNSSYTETPIQYLTDAEDSIMYQFVTDYKGIRILCGIKTPWKQVTSDPKRRFSLGPQMIRSTTLSAHLQATAEAAHRPCRFFAFNAAEGDAISPVENKIKQQRMYQAQGFLYDLKLIDSEALDGRVFKTLSHGLGASMYGLLAQTLPCMDFSSQEHIKDDFQRQTAIDLDCGDRIYQLHYTVPPDAGCRMPDAGCRMPDAGCRPFP